MTFLEALRQYRCAVHPDLSYVIVRHKDNYNRRTGLTNISETEYVNLRFELPFEILMSDQWLGFDDSQSPTPFNSGDTLTMRAAQDLLNALQHSGNFNAELVKPDYDTSEGHIPVARSRRTKKVQKAISKILKRMDKKNGKAKKRTKRSTKRS